jgi:transcriptional regulator with XRE-family HTH domain
MKKNSARPGRPQKPSDCTSFAGQIGSIIRTIRQKHGLTVEECAAVAEVSVPAWYHFESGKIGLDKLPRIADALGVKTKTLIPD